MADNADYEVKQIATQNFEESATITTAGSGAKVSINEDTAYVHGGSKSLKLTISSTKNAGAKVRNIFADAFKTENIGKKYILYGYVYVNDTTSSDSYDISFSAIKYKQANLYYTGVTKSILPQVWTPITMSFDVTQEDIDAGLDSLRICHSYESTTSVAAKEIYVDDLVLYESKETK